MAKILCTRCFEEYPAHQALFRCDYDRCPGREVDHTYAQMQEESPIVMGKVLPSPPTNPFQRLGPPITKTLCSACRHSTVMRICPQCHYELPHDAGILSQRVIAIIGGSTVGKSHYIAALIRRIDGDSRFDGQFIGEESRERWENAYRKRLFQEKKRLEPTQRAKQNRSVRTPLIYRIYTGEEYQKRVLNMSFFDAAGEDMLALDRLDSGVRQVLHAEAILFLIDPLQIETVRQQLMARGETEFPREINAAHPKTIEGRLREFFEKRRGVNPQGKIDIPVAFVLSKIDRVFPLLDRDSLLRDSGTLNSLLDLRELTAINMEIRGLLDQWLPGFTGIVSRHFSNAQFFGVSGLGGDPQADGSIPSVNSIRVEDPFIWILFQLGMLRDEGGR